MMSERTRRDKSRCVVADDNGAVRAQAAAILTAAGYNVAVAGDGAGLAAALAAEAADLVLADSELPAGAAPDWHSDLAAPGGPRVLWLVPAATSGPEPSPALRKPLRREALLDAVAELLAERPLDLSHLRRYTEGDAGLERELTAMFLVSAERYVTDIAQAAVATPAWRYAAHSLKGAARGIGAGELAELAERAEALSPEPATAERARLVAELQEALGRVRNFVARSIPGSPPLAPR